MSYREHSSGRVRLACNSWWGFNAAGPVGPTLVALAALAMVGGGGCGRRSHRPSAPGADRAVGWLTPADGDTVAEIVPLRVDLRGWQPARVIFLADAVPVDTAAAPPWSGTWDARGSTVARVVQLRAVAQGEAAGDESEGSVRAWVMPNSPPRLSVSRPRTATWLRRDLGGRLEARADDAEEGALGPERIRWTGPLLTRPVTGTALPLDLLREEEQRVVAEARDRWGAVARETLLVRPFHYLGGETPMECLDNVAAALRAREPAELGPALADSFRFVPCAAEAARAGWPGTWPRDGFLAMAGRWLDQPAGREVTFSWATVRVISWRALDREEAWVECAGVTISEAGAEADEAAAGHSALQFSLRRPAGEPWRIVAWRELAGGDGASLAGRLASATGWPRPRPGAGCLVREGLRVEPVTASPGSLPPPPP